MPDIGDIFKDLVWGALVRAALGALFKAAPFLGWGPIGIIVTFLVTQFAEKLYEVVREYVQIEVIILRNEAHRKEYDAASTRLKIIAHSSGIDSPEFQKARDENKKALSKFVQFG